MNVRKLYYIKLTTYGTLLFTMRMEHQPQPIVAILLTDDALPSTYLPLPLIRLHLFFTETLEQFAQLPS
jgi:hypothetical protein